MDWIGVEGRTVSDSREAGHGRRETQLDGKEFVKLRNCFLFSFFSFFLFWCFVLGFFIPLCSETLALESFGAGIRHIKGRQKGREEYDDCEERRGEES